MFLLEQGFHWPGLLRFECPCIRSYWELSNILVLGSLQLPMGSFRFIHVSDRLGSYGMVQQRKGSKAGS